MKKWISVIAAIILTLTITACDFGPPSVQVIEVNKNELEATKETPYVFVNNEIALPFDQKQSLNPIYTNSALNLQLSHLMFDSLIYIDNTFSPIPSLFKNWQYDTQNMLWYFEIDNERTFSNGDMLTADDVVNTLKEIKNNKTSYYYSRLENVKYISTFNNGVQITLKQPNLFFPNLLDIPVVKLLDIKDKENFIGCGAFKLLKDDGYKLRDTETDFEIKLIQQSSKDSLISAVETAEIDAYVTLSTNDTVPYHMGNFANYDFLSNQMCFIGMNNKNQLLGDANFRILLSMLTDRSKILNDSLFGNGEITYLPQNPKWEYYPDDIVNEFQENSKNSYYYSQLIGKIGITTSENGTLQYKGQPIVLKMIVNYENAHKLNMVQAFVRDMEDVGITVEIEELDYEEFQNRLKKGEFELYFGEIRLQCDMNFSVFLTNGELNFGKIDTPLTKSALKNSNEKFIATGEQTTDEIAKAYLSEMPIIPLFFIKEKLYVAQNYKGIFNPTAGREYGNLEVGILG